MLISLMSAKGSPGVTTAAVALGAVWPTTAVLADVDPVGGDLGVRYRGEYRRPLDPQVGVVSLGAELRRGADVAVDSHVQVLAGGLPALLGVTSPDQVTGIGPVWPAIARALANARVDVLADCGRMGAASPVQPVLAASDLIIALTRPDAAALAHLRTRLRSMEAGLRRPGQAPVGVVVVAAAGARDVADGVQRLFDSSGVDVMVLGLLADDRRGALALERADAPRAARSALVRSARGLVPRLMAAASRSAAVPTEA